MKKIITVILVGFCFVACKKDPAVSGNKNADSLSMMGTNDSLQIHDPNSFQKFSFPEEIQGCSCAFAANKEEYDKEIFIFADDYGAKALVKYKGETLEFPMEEGDFDPSHFDRVLKNEKGYTLKMKAIKRNSDPETMVFEGEMTLLTPDGKSIFSTFYGECAC
jgi:hypothetical protein